MLLDLLAVATALDAKGVTDGSRIDAAGKEARAETDPGVLSGELAAMAAMPVTPDACCKSLKSGLRRVYARHSAMSRTKPPPS